ncbi:MAG: transglycosylase domain-containing protein [Anaerolineaceae bacterium]|nr:transglycosylase domain-containing protein [Anaerolineaceae bacterium]
MDSDNMKSDAENGKIIPENRFEEATKLGRQDEAWFCELSEFGKTPDFGADENGASKILSAEAEESNTAETPEPEAEATEGNAETSAAEAESLAVNIPMGDDEQVTLAPDPSSPDMAEAEILPQRVAEYDPQATVLSPAALNYQEKAEREGTQPIPTYHPSQPTHLKDELPFNRQKPAASNSTLAPAQSAQQKKSKKEKSNDQQKSGKGCFLRAVMILLTLLVILLAIGGAFAFYKYTQIAKNLPDVQELKTRASKFETTKILDRNGGLLYEIMDPTAGKRTYVPLNKISPYLIAATIATEDKEYYNHPGFDVLALTRALWSNYRAGGVVSGASTITQQLARMILLPEQRFKQSYERKASEIILAAEITRRFTKEEVLELYLNEIFYGNLSYGIEAAAETYFNTSADKLDFWQSSFLAGLPQSPAIYDIYKNRDATLQRNKVVMLLTYNLSQERNCIKVGENLDKVCVDPMMVTDAESKIQAYNFVPKDYGMRFPHWVVYIQSLLEARFDPQTIYRSGFTVYTTLDPDFQERAEQAVRDQLAQMQGNNATNGAVIAMNPKNGEILSMVGSADFGNAAISGQVNMALTETRQPGSAIKPLTYVGAFEKDWNPATIIWDVPSSFPPSGKNDDPADPYVPVNYDGEFHGPVSVRTALANSFNIPAVKALQYVGIYDEAAKVGDDGFIKLAQRFGIHSLTRPDYGLSLTLGGGEVSLLEMTGAYSVLANEGKRVAPVAVTKVVDYTGAVIYEYIPPAGEQVVRPAHAYLISDILSDAVARSWMFGNNSVLNLPFPSAVKTGTTNDFRDNWTLGYTPDLVVGVWIGNADYSPMEHTTGVSGAAPVWAQLMVDGIGRYKGGVPSPFVRPPDVVEKIVCSLSGTEPSDKCPGQRSELFASDQLPPPKDQDLWAAVKVDGWTGLKLSEACKDFPQAITAINIKDKSAIAWLSTEQGKGWAEENGFTNPITIVPERECRMDDPRPIIDLLSVMDGGTIIEDPFKITGVIDATANFRAFTLEWGEGEKPEQWQPLASSNSPVKSPTEIAVMRDLRAIHSPLITFKVTLFGQNDAKIEKFYRMHINLPAITPTATATETPTAMPTEEPSATPAPPADTPVLPSATPEP